MGRVDSVAMIVPPSTLDGVVIGAEPADCWRARRVIAWVSSRRSTRSASSRSTTSAHMSETCFSAFETSAAFCTTDERTPSIACSDDSCERERSSRSLAQRDSVCATAESTDRACMSAAASCSRIDSIASASLRLALPNISDPSRWMHGDDRRATAGTPPLGRTFVSETH